MKNKNSTLKLLFFITSALINSAIFAQVISPKPVSKALWSPQGSDTVTTSREVFIPKNLKVQGTITADSGHYRTIVVGDSSLWIGAPPAQNQIGVSDNIESTNGSINFGGKAPLTFDDIKIGIGNTAPVDALDVTGAIALNGLRALSNFGTKNIFVGEDAGFSNTGGFQNAFIGYRSGYFNTSGSSSTFVGDRSGFKNTTGSSNSFFGIAAGFNNTTGSGNSFFGATSGSNNTTGSGNSFFGIAAGGNNTTGTENSFLGIDAGFNNSIGIRNTFIGSIAGYNNTAGNHNTIIGFNAGLSNTTGSNNTYLGYFSNGLPALTNATAIGNRTYVTQSHSLVLGYVPGQNGVPATDPAVNVAIGTTAPSQRLELRNGNFLISNSNNTAGEVRFAEPSGSGTNYTAFKAQAQTADITYTLPAVQVTGNTFLKNDGSGNLSWEAVAVGSGIGTCTNPTVLSANSGIQLSSNNFYFEGSSATAERVAVGVTCGNSLTAKFNVNGNAVIGNSYIGTATSPANGLLVQGFTGIGSAFTTANPPARQLDIFNSASPQLRLTQTFAGGLLGLPSYTDFQTTSAGNLRINPSDGLFGLHPTVGINVPAGQEPQNTLEIVSGFAAPTPSGLRFRNLTSSAVPVTNPGNGLLSVNSSGDVIYVTGGNVLNAISADNGLSFSAGHTGNASPHLELGGSLHKNTDVPLDIHSLTFSGPGSVGIGTATPPGSKLKVVNSNVGQWATEISSSYQNSSAGSFGLDVKTDGSTTLGIGIRISTSGPITSFNTGIVSSASGGAINRGCEFTAGGGTNNYGGQFSAIAGSNLNYGILALTTNNDPGVLGKWAGVFVGKVFVTDPMTSISTTIPSDTLLKKDITSFSSGLNIIRNIQPISFKYNGKIGLDSTRNYIGAIAEDIAVNAPYAIDTFHAFLDSTDSQPTTLLSIKSEAIMYTTINAVKELDSMVTTLLPLLPPDAPVLASPANGATGLPLKPIELKWYKSERASSYTGAVFSDSSLSVLVSKFSNPDTSAIVSVADYNHTYYWRVRADNASGPSTVSETFRFTTQIAPPNPSDPSTSDIHYKENITDIDSALEKVLQLHGVYFDWKTQDFPDLNFDTTRYMGFIAQEVQPIVPEVIFQNDTGALSMDYGRMVALLVEAMKQQQQTIDSLKSQSPDSLAAQITTINQQLATMQSCIDNLPPGMCGGSFKMANPGGNQSGNGQNPILSGQKTTFKDVVLKGEIILDQNNPNPFKESTTITYFIPEYINFAQIIFSDNTGRIINTVDIDHTGQGQLNVKAEKLGSGMYSYSIVVDGKTIDTKKMLKTK